MTSTLNLDENAWTEVLDWIPFERGVLYTWLNTSVRGGYQQLGASSWNSFGNLFLSRRMTRLNWTTDIFPSIQSVDVLGHVLIDPKFDLHHPITGKLLYKQNTFVLMSMLDDRYSITPGIILGRSSNVDIASLLIALGFLTQDAYDIWYFTFYL